MLLSTVLAAALLSTAPLQARASAPPPAQNTSTETAEGVEILRRVLIEALDQAFEEKRGREKLLFNHNQGVDVGGLVTTLWAGGQTVQHARAFHLPEAGLFFALDVALPVVKKEQEEPGSDQPQDDEWERARREVRGSLAPNGVVLRSLRRGASSAAIDPQAIEQVIDVVLRGLARHVARIEGLGAHESVTVALRLSGRDRSWLHEWSADEPHGLGRLGAEQPGHDEGEMPEETPESMAFSAYVLATGHEVREQNLVLQVRLSDLIGAGTAAPEQLRRATRINRY